jgi:hypothetical protein
VNTTTFGAGIGQLLQSTLRRLAFRAELLRYQERVVRPEAGSSGRDSRARSLQRMVRPHCYLVKVRPGLLNLQTEDTFQTLAKRDSFGPTGARLMSTHLLAG